MFNGTPLFLDRLPTVDVLTDTWALTAGGGVFQRRLVLFHHHDRSTCMAPVTPLLQGDGGNCSFHEMLGTPMAQQSCSYSQ